MYENEKVKMTGAVNPLQNLVRYMHYLQKGLVIHTDNLSRADIPNAHPNELKPFEKIKESFSIPRLSSTHQSHFGGLSNAANSSYEVKKINTNVTSLSGNDIEREDELKKINDISTDYIKAVRLYQKSLSFFKTILS